MATLPNSNIQGFTPLVSLQDDDVFAVQQLSTGITKKIRAGDFVNTTSQDFEWVTTATYNLDDVVTYNGKWWQSLIGSNTGNLPQEGAIWTEVSASNNFAFWVAGLYSQDEVIVLITYYETVRLARLKNATRPFVSADFDIEFKNDDWEFVSEDELRAVNETAHGWVVNDALKITASGYEKSTGMDTVAVVVKVVDANNVIISLVGDVLHGFSALTPGDRMYVQPDGSIDTPITDYLAGISISTTEILNAAFIVAQGEWTADATFTAASGTEIQNTGTTDITGQTGTAAFTFLDINITVGARSASGDINFVNWKKDATSVFKVDVDGRTYFPDGTVSLPSMTFLNDPDNGFYRIGTDNWAAASGGIKAWEIDSSQNIFMENGVLTVRDGDASVTPNSSSMFVAETNTALSVISIVGTATHRGILMFGDNGDSFIGGIEYAHTTDEMKISVNNLEAINISSTIITTIKGQLKTTSTTTLPAINVGGFAGDPSSLVNGDWWYNSTSNKFRAYENGAAVNVIGGGATDLSDLTDANITSPAQGQMLFYNNGSSEFQNTADLTFSGGILTVNHGTASRIKLAIAGATKGNLEMRSATVLNLESEAGVDLEFRVGGSANASLAIDTSNVFTLINGADFSLGSTTGTKWGTATGQKQAWWNATPVTQPAHIADASGGATVDTEARAAINALLAQHAALGLQAAS